jgi:hypothetical protein
MLAGCSLIWNSKLQKEIALSSTEDDRITIFSALEKMMLKEV